jgi:WD40 repeat protein
MSPILPRKRAASRMADNINLRTHHERAALSKPDRSSERKKQEFPMSLINLGLPRLFGVLVAGAFLVASFSERPSAQPVAKNNFPIEVVFNGPVSPLLSIITPDGKFAIFASGNAPELWDLPRKRLIRKFVGLPNQVQSIAVSPDAARIAATTFTGKTIYLWDVVAGQVSTTIDTVLENARDVRFANGGRAIVYGGASRKYGENELVIRDLSSGRQIVVKDTGGPMSIDVSSDGARIVTGSYDGQIRVIGLNGAVLRKWEAGHVTSSAKSVLQVAFSPNGQQVASGGFDGAVKIWNASGSLEHSLPGLAQTTSLSWSPDGLTIAATDSRTLRIWNVRSGRPTATTTAESARMGFLHPVRHTPDGRFILATSNILDAATLQVTDSLGGDRASVLADAAPSESEVYIAGQYRRIYSLDFKSGQLRSVYQDPDGSLQWFNVAISRDGQHVVAKKGSSTQDRSLLYVDLQQAGAPKVLATNVDDLWGAAIAPDGKTIATYGKGNISLLDSGGREIRRLSGSSDEWTKVPVFSNDGQHLISGHSLGSSYLLRQWRVQTGKAEVQTALPAGESLHVSGRPSFSTDGQSFLLPSVGTWDGSRKYYQYQVNVYSTRNLQLLKRVSSPALFNVISNVAAYHPDGNKLVVGSFDGKLRLFEFDRRTETREYVGHSGPIASAKFSSKGDRIISSANDGLKVWDTASGALLASYAITAQGEWVAVTPEGFFDASENGAQALSIVQGLEVTSIDQLYQALYRPDLVREKLAGDPRGLVREAAAKLDLTKVMASGAAPKVAITAPPGGNAPTDELTAEALITDNGGGIGKIEWRVNGLTLGVEERGLGRVDGTPGQAAALRVSRKLSLEPGENVIEVVVYNGRNLIASDPARVTVKWDGANPATPPRLHVLAIGVNDYWDSRIRLSYAVPDARAIVENMSKAAGGLYQSVETTLVLDADVTSANLEKVFTEVSRKVQPRDVFVFFLAGHGKTVDGKYYFLPQDFRYENEQSIVSRGIDQDRFQSWFAKVSARKSILLYDTCESGSLTGDRVAQRGIERVAALEKMTRAMGRTVLSASTEDAPALEGYRGHGVFTYALLDGLNAADANGNGLIEVTELAGYIDQKVPDLSYEAFKLRQVPQMKIVGSNFPLIGKYAALAGAAGQTASSQASPAATAIPTRPTHVVIAPTTVRQSAAAHGVAIIELQAGSQVTLVQAEGQWVIVARDGKRIGYVEEKALARLH